MSDGDKGTLATQWLITYDFVRTADNDEIGRPSSADTTTKEQSSPVKKTAEDDDS